MLEVSARRIASALFLCLVVCEDHVAHLEKKEAGEIEEQRRIEKEREREREIVLGKEKENEKKSVDLYEIDKSSEGSVRESNTDNNLNNDEKKLDNGVASTDDVTYSGGILFHCAQGKDRTGILAMLLTFSLYGDTPAVEERAAREYGVSEELLVRGREKEVERARERMRERKKIKSIGNDDDDDDDEEHFDFDSNSNSNSNNNSNNNDMGIKTTNIEKRKRNEINSLKNSQKSSNNKKDESKNKNKNLGEIQSLKGSPPKALKDTLTRVRAKYGGSILGYLDHIGFTKDYRKRLQITAEKTAKLQSK